MSVSKKKAFSFKQIEIITMVLTKLYFLWDALDHFGHEIGIIKKDKDDDSIKYQLWRKEISLDNYRKDEIFVKYFKDRLNHHIQFQPNLRKVFKCGLKGNPLVNIQIKDWTNHKEKFTKWYFEKFDTSTLLSDTGMEKILEVDRSLFVDKKTINPKLLMEEGNRIWKAYKFSEVYTLPKIKQLSDYRYVDINEYKNKV